MSQPSPPRDTSGQPRVAGCSGIEGLIIPNAASTYGTVGPNFTHEPGVTCPGPSVHDLTGPGMMLPMKGESL